MRVEQGIIASASYLVDVFDQPTYAKQLLKHHGISPDDVREYADEYDLEILDDLLDEMELKEDD